MTNKRAAKVLTDHKKILENAKYDSYFLWQQQALSYIDGFLGKESGEYNRMNSFKFPEYEDKNYDNKLSVIRHQLLTVIDQSINTVNHVGIKRVYHNFLCRYSDKELIAALLASAGVIFGAGIALEKLIFHCPNV